MQLVAEKKVRAAYLLAGATLAAALSFASSAQAAKLASCASISAGQSCGASSGPLTATMVPSTHHPKVNAPWPLHVTATLIGKPAHARAIYQFLFGGAVVSTQYPGKDNKHFTFVGSFNDNLVFPKTAVGYPLTLQVVIKDGGRTVNLDWPIDTVK
jgi:hypothetical protein